MNTYAHFLDSMVMSDGPKGLFEFRTGLYLWLGRNHHSVGMGFCIPVETLARAGLRVLAQSIKALEQNVTLLNERLDRFEHGVQRNRATKPLGDELLNGKDIGGSEVFPFHEDTKLTRYPTPVQAIQALHTARI